MKNDLLAKLEILKKKYPDREFRALLITDDSLNITTTLRNSLGTTTIDSHNYNGIVYQTIVQDKMFPKGHQALKLGLIVDKMEFLLSSSRAYALLMEYGI
ncbi:hypothetical protein [Ligilactobacillus faecis]|uniref:hypothetical protein n=1 Tax=Ligilactobacillus faecis TaxID=762833 RepID=UPI0024682D1E|nr:hypothetical protein [Ligilactobacillus faecis]WGN89815.1 hypothetical protein QFX10_01705 [Ligilactobacillus faecis]